MILWAIVTCIPTENEPCWPRLFSTVDKANAAFDKLMRAEWDAAAMEDEETGESIPYPDTSSEAHDKLEEWGGGEWGKWSILSVEVDAEV